MSPGRRAFSYNFVADTQKKKNKPSAKFWLIPGLGELCQSTSNFFLGRGLLRLKLFIIADLNMSNRRRGRTARLRVINRSHLDDIDHGKGFKRVQALFVSKSQVVILNSIVIHDEDFERFRNWLRERGYPKSKITLAEFEGLRHCFHL